MKKMNLLAMSLVSAAALSFSSCSSNDDLAGGGTQSQADGVYMTLSIAGSNQGTRTTGTNLKDGTPEESTIESGTIYLYDKEGTCIFRKDITKSMFDTQPTQTEVGKTKPIKVSINTVKTGETYTVYFLANRTGEQNPLTGTFTSNTGGKDFGENNAFAMFNQNDEKKAAAHSTVEFTDKAKDEAHPAEAQTIFLDRVVARIDKPTVDATVTTIEPKAGTTTTIDIDKTIKSIGYEAYTISNVNNASFIKQNWTTNWESLIVEYGTPKYYLPTETFGGKYEAKKTELFGNVPSNYVFENTTEEEADATALYFRIKAELTDAAKDGADFTDGTFYRYDKRLFTSIQAIFNAAETGEISNPFAEAGAVTVDQVLEQIKNKDGSLKTEAELASFREKNKIEIYRGGEMYYRYAIHDNLYKPTTYSVLRNTIYQLNVTQISEVGNDVPNGPKPDDPIKNPNYYMTVQVQVNPWILNTKDIELK